MRATIRAKFFLALQTLFAGHSTFDQANAPGATHLIGQHGVNFGRTMHLSMTSAPIGDHVIIVSKIDSGTLSELKSRLD